jgi:hypothetical protein
VDPPNKTFPKLVNENVIKPEKGVHSLQNFHNPYISSSNIIGKTSWALPLDF